MASATTEPSTAPSAASADEDGDDDVGGVGLEEAAERLAGVAAAEAVGAERDERASSGTNRAIWSGTAFMKSVTAMIGPGARAELRR